MTATNFKFAKDPSYSDSLTARAFGFAFVVFADNEPSRFCVQVFDERDDEELRSGEPLEAIAGFRSMGEAMSFCDEEALRLYSYML